MLVFIVIIILLPGVELQSQWSFYNDRHIQCYSCSDCPEPFFAFHAQITITPPDVGACMKTVVYMQNSGRRIISKGFTRNCVPEYSPNAAVYCCHYNLCNTSNVLSSSVVGTIVIFLIIMIV